MLVIDASSMIYAWDNYPKEQFPGLWEWMESQIEEGNLVIPSVALDEVSHKVPECCDWLRDSNIEKIEMTNSIVQDAMRIKGLIGVVDDRYHPKGVDENDLFIIATARAKKCELISEEAKQPTLPKNEPTKRKIPAVCAMNGVDVTCINFIEYLKSSQAIFR